LIINDSDGDNDDTTYNMTYDMSPESQITEIYNIEDIFDLTRL